MSTTSRPRRPRCCDADAGYSVLEAAIVLPLIFFLIMLIVQWAVVWHARSVTEAAAQEGLRTAEQYQASAAQGHADTISYLSQVAPHSLPDPQVTVTRNARTATVTVTATVASVIPFGHFTVTETASGPVETYVDAP
ncbi:MAG TPA: TadE family protein [Mycobacteriales bacterium]|nr:TadE family protein [Mycobacteriales bacterium]